MMPLHSHANYVTDDGLIVMGAEPIEKTLPIINTYDLVINLTLSPSVSISTAYAQFFMPVESLPTDKQLKEIIALITDYHSQSKSVYVYCKGGHGRSGTICAIYLGILYKLDGAQAVARISSLHDSRVDRGRLRAPAPETQRQVQFVMKHLGHASGQPIPDRTDMSWAKKRSGK